MVENNLPPKNNSSKAPIVEKKNNKLQKIVWGVCFLILLQIGWVSLRFNKLQKKKQEEIKDREEQIAEQEKAVKEELEMVEEPQIEEKLAKGGKLWLKPEETVVSASFDLEIWLEAEKPVEKIDLKLFYPSDVLKVTGEEWSVDEEAGIASWSGELALSQKPEEETDPESKITEVVKTISFKPLTKKKGEVVDVEIEFDFNKESLLDCNLIDENGNDILESVKGAKINLKI